MENLLRFVTAPAERPYALCDEFGSCANLFRFIPDDPQSCGGRLKYSCQDPLNIKIDIQPMGEKLEVKPSGHSTEAIFKFFLNPYHPDNLAANAGSPVFLRTSDSEFIVPDYDSTVDVGHGDVIEYLGQKLIVCQVDLWGGDDCGLAHCGESYYQEGYLALWGSDTSEREANIDNDTFTYDGELVTR